MAHSAQPGPRRIHVGAARRVHALVEVLAFACELAMIAVLGIAGWSLGSGGLISIALLVFYPALAILLWAVWIAPTASRRLDDPWRLCVQLALFAGTAALSAAGGHVLLGVTFGIVAWLVFIATRFTGGDTAPAAQSGG